MPVNTLLEYTIQKISTLPDAALLVVVFDPYATLNLAESIDDEKERSWQVIIYDGNDLAFRKRRPKTGLQIVWVVLPEGQRNELPPRMIINSLSDIWLRADMSIDASLPGILHELVPTETWPVLPLWAHAAILGQNLPAISPAVVDMRRYLDRNAALDESAIRALALHCLHPDLPAHEFLFQTDTSTRVLQKYLSLLWNGQWNETGRKLLQLQAQKAPKISTDNIQTWLTATSVDLAQYIYLRQAMRRFEVSSPVNQLRGLGILKIDPELFEPYVSRLLETWDQTPDWKQEIIDQAEAYLSDDDVYRLVDLFEREDPQTVLQAIQLAETPAILSALLIKFIQTGLQTGQFEQHSYQWLRPASLSYPTQNRYTEACIMLAGILDEIAFIDSTRQIVQPDNVEIARLLDWYTSNKIYDLEYAQARAAALVMRVPENIREAFRKYLNVQRKWIKAFLNKSDHLLAQAISENWNGYLGHTRLSTNVLWDTVKKKRIHATKADRLWIIIFDGMRWDTWIRHVRPRLLENFEVVEAEKPYISLLPSWTRIARTGLLAGKIPGNWSNEQGRPTMNQSDLVARLLEIRRQEMRFSSTMESDQKLSQLLDKGDFAYNVLVYNISDDNLHSIRGSLVDLNKAVDGIVERVAHDLVGLIGDNDHVIISSDHGFTELDPDFAFSIADDSRWQRQTDNLASPIRYRYILGGEIPPELNSRKSDVLKIAYKNHPEEYIVPVGNLWFKRAENTGALDRYSHGGISFAEMVVPGAVLKRITQRVIKPEFEFEPKSIVMEESEIAKLKIWLANKGNTPIAGNIIVQTDLGGDVFRSNVLVPSGGRQEWLYPVVGIYRKLSNGREEATKSVKVILTYKGIEGQEVHLQKRVNVAVQPRIDKVEIDFGGLSDLD